MMMAKSSGAKRWIIGALIASTSSVGLMGCTDDEVAEAVGDIAVVAGAVLIATTTQCEGGYQQVCHEYRDYHGNTHTECEQTYDSCAALVPRDNIMAEAPAKVIAQAKVNMVPGGGDFGRDSASPALSEVKWGQTFGISFEASKTFIAAMESAKAKDIQPILALGLSRDDLKKVSGYALPSKAGLDALAQSLNIDEASAQSMVQKLIDQAKTQAQAQEQTDSSSPASYM